MAAQRVVAPDLRHHDIDQIGEIVDLALEQASRVQKTRDEDERGLMLSRGHHTWIWLPSSMAAVGRDTEEGLGRRRGVAERDEEVPAPLAEPRALRRHECFAPRGEESCLHLVVGDAVRPAGPQGGGNVGRSMKP